MRPLCCDWPETLTQGYNPALMYRYQRGTSSQSSYPG